MQDKLETLMIWRGGVDEKHRSYDTKLASYEAVAEDVAKIRGALDMMKILVPISITVGLGVCTILIKLMEK